VFPYWNSSCSTSLWKILLPQGAVFFLQEVANPRILLHTFLKGVAIIGVPVLTVGEHEWFL